MDERMINGKRVVLVSKVERGDGGAVPVEHAERRIIGNAPLILWGTFLHEENEIEHFVDELEKIIPEGGYILAAFFAEDWNRDFSPWEAPAVFGNEDFAGKGAEMLDWLTDQCIPQLEQDFGTGRPKYLIGYSLAGLFALWAGYETDMFDGIASCSGSLWFRDWDSYVNSHTMKHFCNVYLSLGTKEEKTRNRQMALVGDRTREQFRILESDEHVKKLILEWNPGGHFADSGKRLAKGVRWLMEQRYF
ncbi:MAG: alpha/beta hydrolase-fold protein [Lachnospiraceae bacterium]|nr:alpha/beta hydrolase-fold protein [Lachnospiraceae bacterium]